jgi:hypothetical protein
MDEKDKKLKQAVEDVSQALQSDMQQLVNIFKNNDNNIKARRANIDAIIDEDFADLEDVFKKLA